MQPGPTHAEHEATQAEYAAAMSLRFAVEQKLGSDG